MGRHVVLLGDSIFDNRYYVQPGEPAVIDQLHEMLPNDTAATLLAVDGDIITDVKNQWAELPDDATHLVLSAGGNDALGRSAMLERQVRSAAEVFDELADIHRQFRLCYHEMIAEVVSLNRHVAVCTIYDQIPMSDPELRRRIVAALTLFNDCILRVAFSFGLPVLDLRAICVDPQDFSELSPIEPSAGGGDKIARAISTVVQHHDFSRRVTAVYT